MGERLLAHLAEAIQQRRLPTFASWMPMHKRKAYKCTIYRAEVLDLPMPFSNRAAFGGGALPGLPLPLTKRSERTTRRGHSRRQPNASLGIKTSNA